MNLRRLAFRSLIGLALTLAVVYLGDCAVWQVRVARGGGMGTVVVNRVVVAQLKGNREEYYADGSETVNCSVSMFPQAGAGACWWVMRNRTVFQRGSHG